VYASIVQHVRYITIGWTQNSSSFCEKCGKFQTHRPNRCRNVL